MKIVACGGCGKRNPVPDVAAGVPAALPAAQLERWVTAQIDTRSHQ